MNRNHQPRARALTRGLLAPLLSVAVTAASLGSGLAGVAARPGGTVWAVGNYAGFDLQIHTLILEWTGAQWTRWNSPDPAGAWASYLRAVAVTGTSDAIAVGYANTTASETLVERFITP